MPQIKRSRARLAPSTLLVVALLASVVSGAARAEDEAGKPAWSFGGFGSIGAVHSNERQADFVPDTAKKNGVGYSHRWSADVDSRLGAQLDLSLNPQWSGALQVISEQGVDNSYAPIIQWANIKYQATPDLSVRVGRIALPLLMASDNQRVAFSIPWIRPPVEVYGVFLFSNSDGVDISYRWHHDNIKNITQAFYGRTDFKIDDGGVVKARKMAGLSNSTTYGAGSVHASILIGNVVIDATRPLFDGFRQFGAQGIALASKYDTAGKRGGTVSIGASFDPGQWFVMSELARVISKSSIGDKTSLYASAGVRFGNVTPYLTYSQIKSNSNISDAGLSLTGLPPRAAGAAAALNAGLNRLLGSMSPERTFTAGVRWDVLPNRALKLQYDRVLPQDGSAGMLINVQPGFKPGGAVNVVSVVLDFLY
jgi:hypothetical protein